MKQINDIYSYLIVLKIIFFIPNIFTFLIDFKDNMPYFKYFQINF